MADPFMKFYPTDWRSDPRLRSCSLGARGLWIELVGLMHEADPYGHLLIAARAPTDAQLSVLVGTSPAELSSALGELEAAGVFSRTSKGVIYSRRMTRDAKKAAISRKNGKKGGNPTLRNQKENQPWDKGEVKGWVKTQKPEARSQIEEGGGGGRAREPAPASARGDDPPPDLANLPDDAVRLYEQVMAACGVPQFPLPRYWMPPMAIIEVVRWRGYGLADEEIVEVARGSRKSKTGPPDGPKALERFMATAASVKVNRRKPMQQITGDSQNDRDSSSDAGSETLRRSLARAATPDKGVAGW